MRAAQIVQYRKPLEVVDLPEPKPGPRDVVLRVEACGICRSDWHLWNGDWDWMGFQAPLPHVPGHEIGGVVVEAGEEVERVKVGARVTVPWTLACGECDSCRRGHTNVCERVGVAGFVGPGAYAEYVAIPNADLNVIPVPESVDPLSAAALGCRYMSAFGAVVRQGEVRPGEWVTVIGAGGMGLSAVQIATAAGANVIAVDIDATKLQKAKEEGAAAVVLAENGNVPEAVKEISGEGAHLSIDCVSKPETMLNSLLGLRRGGRHVQAAYTTQPERGMLPIPADLVGLLEARIIGSGAGLPHSDMPTLISLIERGVLTPGSLVTQKVGLAEVTNVYEAMDDFRTVGFSVITSF